MKKSLLVIALATVSLLTQAQQDPQFTMWQFDRLSVNPAIAGIERMHYVSAFHRDQWDGFDRDPKTYLFNYHGMYGAKQNIGLGATFVTEVLGQQQNNILRFAGAYHHALGNNNYISGGMSLGFIGSKLGANWIYIDDNDAAIPRNETAASVFDLNLGGVVYQPNKYYIGLSATHLTGGDLDELNMSVARHVYLMGGYEYALGSGDLVLRPNALLKSDLNATQFDINADVLWNKMLWGGLAFRPGDAIAPYAGFMYQFAANQTKTSVFNHGIRLGYSYDVTTSEIRNYSSGSHEIFVTYFFGITEIPVRAKHHNPRFL